MEQAIVSGFALGALYALVGLGFVLTWIATRSLNFAQGEFVAFAALGGVTLALTLAALPQFAAWIISLAVIVVLGGVAGVLVERVAIRGLADNEQSVSWILSTVAVSIILVNVAQRLWGTAARPLESPFGSHIIRVGEASFLPAEAVVVVALLVFVVGLEVFLRRTWLGLAIRAISQDRYAGLLMGVNVTAVAASAYALASALAGVAGLLAAPIVFASATMGLNVVINGFAVAILGGLDSIRGVAIAGVLFGMVESLIRFSDTLGPRYASVFGLGLIVLVLVVRPSGLLGTARLRKV